MKTVRKLLLALVLGLAVPACDISQPELDIVLERDFSEVIQAINDANKSLTDKLTLIDAAFNNKMAGNRSLLELVQGALASLSGTQEEKLAAILAAVNARSTSLETKLALVEAAVQGGFTEARSQQALLRQAIDALTGSAKEKLAAIETAVNDQSSSFETRLGLIEAAVKKGLADSKAAQELISQAISTMGTTLEDKLAAIKSAVESDNTTLETKLGLLSTALNTGLTQQGSAFEMLKSALDDLKPIDTAQQTAKTQILSGLETLSKKLTTEELAKAYKDMADAIDTQEQSLEEVLNNLLTVVNNLAEDWGAQYQLALVGDPTQQVTLTKGSTFRVKLSVSPADFVLKKDNLQLKLVSRKLFYPEGSTIGTDPDHFVISSLEAEPGTAGQYVVTISTQSAVAVWDESVFCFVYNFGNDQKARYVGTHPFPVTMMPRIQDGLERRYYPNGSFLMKLPGQDFMMGTIYYALGRKRFFTEDGSESRTYSADNITRAKFIQPDRPDTASVFTKLDSKHFVSFSPDTVGNKTWRAFQKRYVEDHLSQEVTGQLALTDRWGTTDSFDVRMKWYVTWPIPYEIVDTVGTAKPSDFVLLNGSYVRHYPQIWSSYLNPWGLDFDDIHNCGVELENKPTGSGGNYEEMQLVIPEDSASSTYLKVMKGVKPVAGKRFQALGFLGLFAMPSDVEPYFRPPQIYYDYQITIKVID